MNLLRPKLLALFLLFAGIVPYSYGPRAAIDYSSFAGGCGHDAKYQYPGKPLYRNGLDQHSFLHDFCRRRTGSRVAGLSGFGIKVKDMETWVGLGWRLSTGGRISRMVRGAQGRRGRIQQSFRNAGRRASQ